MPIGKRNHSLDLLRGIAILCVLDYHFAPTPQNPVNASLLAYPLDRLGLHHFGWIGVDIFFVLSGFLVGGLLVKEWKLNGKIRGRDFLFRRALKIWPQYYFFLAVMLALHPSRAHAMIGNFLNIQNYTGTPFHLTWSLAVEEHFYLLLTIAVAWFAARNAPPRRLYILLTAIGIFITIFRAARLLHGATNIYATHMRLDGLLWGVLLAILYHWAPKKFATLQKRRWPWLFVLCTCVAIIAYHRDEFDFAMGISCADWAGVALLLLLYRADSRRSTHPWPTRIIAWIGFYSYGIYLWHESVLGPVAALSAKMPTHTLHLVVEAVAPWIASIALGVITTKLIEIPTLRLRDRFFPRPVGPVLDHAS